MSLEQYLWRLFVAYHTVTLVISALVGYLPAWGVSVLITYAINRIVLYWAEQRWTKS